VCHQVALIRTDHSLKTPERKPRQHRQGTKQARNPVPPPKDTQKKTGRKGSKPPERRRKMQQASRVASSLVTPALRARGFAQTEVVTRWAHIVGPELAASTVPVGLRFPRADRMGGTLAVRCESAFAPLLSHKSERVMQMVNSFFGYQAVSKIEVQQGPLPRRPNKKPLEKRPLEKADARELASLVGEGELSPLREAVRSLGEYVLSGTKKADRSEE
jgi:hypothetical protein